MYRCAGGCRPWPRRIQEPATRCREEEEEKEKEKESRALFLVWWMDPVCGRCVCS